MTVPTALSLRCIKTPQVQPWWIHPQVVRGDLMKMAAICLWGSCLTKSYQYGFLSKSRIPANTGELENMKLLCSAEGMKLLHLLGKQHGRPSKFKDSTTVWSYNCTALCISKENGNQHLKDLSEFPSSLSREENDPVCICGWIEKENVIHMKKISPSLNKGENSTLMKIQMNLWTLCWINTISQTQEGTHSMI